MGPLDHIVQATGRCNREGRLSQGRVIIFHPAEGRAPGDYRSGHDIARAMLNRLSVGLHSPEIDESYFRQLYRAVNTDKHGINELRQRLDIFPEVAARFKLIDDATVPLVVRYPYRGFPGGRSPAAPADPWRASGGEAHLLLRRLQPYLINVRRPWPDTNSQGSSESCAGTMGVAWKLSSGERFHDVAIDPETLVI